MEVEPIVDDGKPRSEVMLFNRWSYDDVQNKDTDYKYLGTRIGADGTVGEYKWTTYGEAATARTAIGSGLVAHGIPKACHVYSKTLYPKLESVMLLQDLKH